MPVDAIFHRLPACEYRLDTVPATVRPEVTTGYDAVGNVRTVTDPRGNLTRTDHNAQNLPTLVMQPDPGPGPGGTAADHPPVLTALTYDPSGNRIEEEVSAKTSAYWFWPTVVMDYKTATEFDNLDRPYQVTDRTGLMTETVSGPARRSHPATSKTPAQVSRSVCAEPPAAASRHVAGDREGTGSCSAGTGACPRLKVKRQGKRDRHRLLRSRSQSLPRHFPDRVSQTDGAGGGRVSPRVTAYAGTPL